MASPMLTFFGSSIKGARETGGANAMKRGLLILATVALMLPPAVLLAQQSPTTPEVKKTAKADEAAKPSGDGAGQAMKDSWITTKTKLALTTDNRTKARHISVGNRA